ncbi:hypothetical protein L6164_034595 [Bauhinia variegata]|uniref:Uncharacterized protein n=1 Tax=Bauhinia variegata TaxID=167791 RepID=A0ACB9KVZ5_BAUVA|nr:hypothetical protein L6164_034595 [Bauhinia variegata]
MNLPDGIQRQRTALDELNIAVFLKRVMLFVLKFAASSMMAYTFKQEVRNMESGQLLTVPPDMAKRQKQHFHHPEQYGSDLILGHNVFIWVGAHIEARDDMIEDQVNQSDPQVLGSNKISASLKEQEQNYTALETRKYICRITNAITILSTLGFNLTLEIIKETVKPSLSLNLDIHEMLGSELCFGCVRGG